MRSLEFIVPMRSPAQPLRAPQRVERQIRALLGTRWRAGERLPPVRLLADMLGAGRSATHQAVKALVRDGLLVARPSIGTLVCEGVEPVDDPSAPAAQGIDELALRRRQVVILHAHFEPRVVALAHNLCDQLNRQGFTASTRRYNIWHQQEQIAAAGSADALVLISPNDSQPIDTPARQHLLVVTSAGSPAILRETGYDVVNVDSQQGGLLAGRRLRCLSAEEICFVGVKGAADQFLDHISAQRLHGFELGLGFPLPRTQVMAATSYTLEHGAEIVPQLAARQPEPRGVFCASDELAMGVAIGALGAGRKAGRDFQLIGFDGQERGRLMHGGPLSTIMLPWAALATTAAELLLARQREPQRPSTRVTLGCSFFAGATTAEHTGQAVK